MRAGAITLQHTLTTEAASVLKHSLSLARKRGHAQVTPLHVATILLSSKTSLLRRACLKSHAQTTSHPLLHSRALELCFSVALNRLPATPGLLLHGQPCISNALVAALKRAQSQQRKGCVEQQQQQLLQQPLLAVKVELEQLILSILDDPSVSRVMREAGFSSSLAKNNLEDSAPVSSVSQYCYNSSSGGVYSTPCSPKYAAVSLPSGGLGLSLNATSVHEPRVASTYNLFQLLDRKPCTIKEEQDRLACCVECTTNYEKEVSMLKSNQQHQLSWILPQGSESLQRDNLTELRRKWSRLCHSIHRGRHIWNHLDSSLLDQQSYMGKNSYTSSYLGWPNQNGASPSNNSIYSTQYNHSASSVPRFRRQQSCHIEFDFTERNKKHQVEETSLVSLKSREGKEVKVTLALGNTLSSSSWEGERKTIDEGEMRKLLHENVPWQSEIIPSIVQVMIRNSTSIKNKNTWLLINGNDSVGKRRLALAIAEAVFGSATSLLCMNMRKRDNKLSQRSTMLQRTLSSSKNMVVLLEDIDYADAQFIDFISKGLKNGSFSDSGEDRGETIFILTKGDPSQYLEDDSNTTPIIQMKLQLGGTTPKSDGKRKAECEFHIQSKTARICEKGADTNATLDSHMSGKDLPRRSSSTILDLNVTAYDECDDQAEGENSPISSDVTFETANDPQSLFGFLDSIENKFTFNQENEKMRESFLSKFRRSFESTEDNHTLSVDEEVLGALSVRCCTFLNSLFDEWLKDVFQTRLKTIRTGGKEATSCIRLCFEGKESCIEDGFMCSNLPKRIH